MTTLTNAQLLLHIVAAAQDCPNWKPNTVNVQGVSYCCDGCGGLGKLPILDPGLMRLPCPNYQATKAFTLGSGWTMEACKSHEAFCRAGKDACNGTGWVPNPDAWAMTKALHKAGFQLTESHAVYEYSQDEYMAFCYRYQDKHIIPYLPTTNPDPERARLLDIINAFYASSGWGIDKPPT